MATLGTFVAGQVLTAAELNQLNNVTALYKTTAQSIPNNADTNVTFGAGTEIVDVSGWHDTSTNNDRITPNAAGIYLVQANVQYNTGTAAPYAAKIQKNGTDVALALAESDFFAGMSCSVILEMNGTTDYVRSVAVQFSGISINTQLCSFSCMLLRKT